MNGSQSISGITSASMMLIPLSGRDSKGKKNGDLLSAAEVAGYEIFLPVDRGIPHQQHQAERKLSTILVRARTNRIDDLVPFVGAILEAIEVIQPGQTIAIRSS